MALLRSYEICCDDCFMSFDGMSFDVKDLRKDVIDSGWVRRDGRDLCDECKNKPENAPGLHKPKRRRHKKKK